MITLLSHTLPPACDYSRTACPGWSRSRPAQPQRDQIVVSHPRGDSAMPSRKPSPRPPANANPSSSAASSPLGRIHRSNSHPGFAKVAATHRAGHMAVPRPGSIPEAVSRTIPLWRENWPETRQKDLSRPVRTRNTRPSPGTASRTRHACCWCPAAGPVHPSSNRKSVRQGTETDHVAPSSSPGCAPPSRRTAAYTIAAVGLGLRNAV
jgi:hypothetical protein